MILKGKVYCTVNFCLDFKNNDSCALMANGDVILITHILVLKSGEIVILSEKLKVFKKPCVGNNHVRIDHLKRAECTGQIRCYPVIDIAQPCADGDRQE